VTRNADQRSRGDSLANVARTPGDRSGRSEGGQPGGASPPGGGAWLQSRRPCRRV